MIDTVRCSGLARPMVCAGFLAFTDLPVQESSPQAEEGTAAGEWFAHLLLGTSPGTHAKNGVQFDTDMDFFTRPLAQEIHDTKQSEVKCEQRIDWQTRSGIWIRGSYDASYIRDGKLYIDDLKYGWGIVEVFENWQLLAYAIGEMMRRQMIFDKIVMRILQPRPHHEDGEIRSWEISYEQLLQYKEKIEQRMMSIAQGNRDLVTSDKCKYCPAAAEKCPAINKAFYRGIEVIHDFVEDSLSEKEISFQLDLIARVGDVLKVKQDSLKSLAVDRLRNGKLIPNYSTETSYGDRKWKPEVTPDIVEAMTGKKIVEQVLLSPAKAEKAGVPREFVNAMVDRQFLGQKLVRKSSSDQAEKVFGNKQ